MDGRKLLRESILPEKNIRNNMISHDSIAYFLLEMNLD
jgi:hypothetical protein